VRHGTIAETPFIGWDDWDLRELLHHYRSLTMEYAERVILTPEFGPERRLAQHRFYTANRRLKVIWREVKWRAKLR